jgi:hypothetical protein
MSCPVYVDAYSGYKANERPRQFTLGEQIYEIAAVLDQWYEPSATYFKVRSVEGKTYLLRYVKRQTNRHCRAVSMAMNCRRDQALNWSPSVQRSRRKQNSKSNHASTVTSDSSHHGPAGAQTTEPSLEPCPTMVQLFYLGCFRIENRP